MRKVTLEESKQIQVELLSAIHEHCNKHNIRYFLVYGTLLGAVRHKGFIPWDDDVDICMFRDDYERFFETFNSEQNGNAKAINCKTEKTYYLPFGKVIDTRTVLKERVESAGEIGVYVDVFVMDSMTGNAVIDSMKEKILLFLRNLLSLKMLPGSDKRKGYRKLIHSMLSGLPVNMNTVSNAMNAVARCKRRSGASAALANVDRREIKNRFSDNLFEELILLPFEGREFHVPAEYDRILTMFYGDYMQLPPEDQRVSLHEYDAWWKES